MGNVMSADFLDELFASVGAAAGEQVLSTERPAVALKSSAEVLPPTVPEAPVPGAKVSEQTSESSHGIHKLLTFISCPRKYAYRYVLNLRLPFDKTALSLGTAVHAGLEAHYLGRDWHLALKHLGQNPEFTYVIDKASKILANYFLKYKGEKLHVLSVEREYGITVEGLLFTRRFDLVYEAGGFLYVVDHKTASDPKRRTGQAELDPTLMSQELVGRITCERVHGYKYGGAVLNLIPTGSGGVFSRYPLRFPPRMVEEMATSLGRWLRGEQTARSSDMSPWDYTQTWSCYEKYGICDYYRLCTLGPEALGEYTVK